MEDGSAEDAGPTASATAPVARTQAHFCVNGGSFAGVLQFSDPPGWPGLELAGALLRRYWGRGYALVAGRAALDHAFNVLGRSKVVSCILPDNVTAIRIVERLGETLEGRTVLEGKEFLVFGIDRPTWEKRRLRGRRSNEAAAA